MPPRNPFYEWLGLDAIEAQLNRIANKLDSILEAQQVAKEMNMAEAQEIQNLVAQVQANKDVVQSATIALKGLLDRVADLNQQLQEAIANAGSDVSPEIRAAAEELAANTAALADAVPHIAHAVKDNTTK